MYRSGLVEAVLRAEEHLVENASKAASIRIRVAVGHHPEPVAALQRSKCWEDVSVGHDVPESHVEVDVTDRGYDSGIHDAMCL